MSVIWLASYPKSGNTWLRAFLSNYQSTEDQPVSINTLSGRSIAVERKVFDELLGISSSDLRMDEIAYYRPLFNTLLAADCKPPCFIKIHDAYQYNAEGAALFPKQAMDGVIYIIRNPLDLAVSFAHHGQKNLDEIIALMSNRFYTLFDNPDKLYYQLPQTLDTWSNHVLSWLDEPDLRILTIRYEDMLSQSATTFRKVVRFSALPIDNKRINLAIKFSQFDRLQLQERQQPFSEKSPTAPSFFRQGKVGEWHKHLSISQVQRLLDTHHEVMARFGYLSEAEQYLCKQST